MKSLKNVTLKMNYDPCFDGTDLVNDFYIPCLSQSIKYDRIAGYFSSTVLKLYSKGLSELFKNGGHVRFIFSCEIDEKDLNEISQAYKEKMDSLEEQLGSDLENDYNIANLSYLIKHNLVDIKIAFMLKSDASLLHMKNGLFVDEEGNKVFFTGSGNETENGILHNAEMFWVFTNFEGPNEYIETGEKTFDALWNNTYSPTTIRTETPVGKLFERLISYDKGRIFNSQAEFDIAEDIVTIDIDFDKNIIVLRDSTKNNDLESPDAIMYFYGDRFEKIDNGTYKIKNISIHDLVDAIPKRLKRFAIEYRYSEKALDYIERENLRLDKRVSLAKIVKQETNEEEWIDKYIEFKETIESETPGNKLTESQYHNAFHHYVMKSSMDFSVPGTGKTYISYGLFAYLNSTKNGKQKEANHMVIFGPLSCFSAWIEECNAIFGPNRFSIFNIAEHHDDYALLMRTKKYSIYLINYDFMNDSKKNNIISQNILDENTFIVFDEIHRIKSLVGVRANNIIDTVNSALRKPIYKLALTGTPIPNSFTDLHNYVKLLYKDDLDSFLSTFSENDLRMADNNPGKADNIKDSLFPLFTRTTKKELDIPEPNPDDLITLCVKPTPEEEKLYELVYKAYDNPLVKFIRLIQASSNPDLLLKDIDSEEIKEMYGEFDYYFDVSNSKANKIYTDEIRETVKHIGLASKTRRTIQFIQKLVSEGKKIIVWCLFLDTIKLLYDCLSELGITAVCVTGSDDVKSGERDTKINSFKNGKVDVLITNPNTLAESISLHRVCHNAVYLEYGFNLTYMLQSKDRIHRVGLLQGTETNYYFAISDSDNICGTIDLKVYSRLQSKAERMKAAIESNDIVFIPSTNDLDDIREIINEMSH